VIPRTCSSSLLHVAPRRRLSSDSQQRNSRNESMCSLHVWNRLRHMAVYSCRELLAEDGPPPVVMGRRRQKRREDFMRKFEFVNYVRQQDSAAETRAAWRGSGRYEAQSALCNDHNAACCCCCCIDVVPCSLLVLYSCSGICE
ncbi:unnamed protein product, partial [Prorocentrum cordatum]